MPGNPSAITTSLAVDPALVQSAGYRMDSNDRQSLDNQIRGAQQHLALSLINGTLSTWVTVDAASAALAVGDVVCLAGSTIGVPTVTKGVLAALTTAGSAFGVVLQAASPGSKVLVAVFGVVLPSVSSLGQLSGVVTVNTTTARAQRAAAFTTGDFALGTVDAQGYMALLPRSPFLTIASQLVADGTGYATLSAANGVKNTGNAHAPDADYVIDVVTPTTAATVIHSFATTTARAYSIRGIIRVQNSPVSAWGEWDVKCFAKNNVGTLVVTTAAPVTTNENQTGFALTYTAVGTNLVLTATDAAGGRRWTGRLWIAESTF